MIHLRGELAAFFSTALMVGIDVLVRGSAWELGEAHRNTRA